MSMTKPLRKNELRRFAEDRVTAQRILRRLQDDLVIAVAKQIKSRYHRAVAYGAEGTLHEWLVKCKSFPATYSQRHFGYKTREYWSWRIVDVAQSITFNAAIGRIAMPEWLPERLAVQLGGGLVITFQKLDNEDPRSYAERYVLAFYSQE